MPPPTHIANRLNRQKKGKQRTTIKCVQLNAQHSLAATSNLTQIIINNIDIAFVQDPYTFHNKVAGYPKGFRIFAQGGGRARAVIIVSNNDMDVTAITQVSNEDAIVTEIRYKGTKLFATSLYLPRDREIGRDLETMEEITQLSRGNGLILAIDSNARSRLWFDKRSNKRGRAIEELIIDRDLIIINEESDTPTFEISRGHSCIGLTICNKTLAQNITGWACGEDESCSDHKLISFDIELREGGGKATTGPGKRYYINTDKWGDFKKILEQRLAEKFDCQANENNSTTDEISHKVKHSKEIGTAVKKFNSAITDACDATFQASKPNIPANKKRSVPWWTQELTILRKKVIALRRRYQRTKTDANLRQERRTQYLEGNGLSGQNERRENQVMDGILHKHRQHKPVESSLQTRSWETAQ